MKTNTIISDVSHEDLVYLFSTALYGSEWLGCVYDKKVYEAIPDKSEEDCFEDKIAKIILSGGSVIFYDCYAEDEDERYGTLPSSWSGEDQTMDYTVNLEDVKAGLQRALDMGGWEAKCARLLMDDSLEFDQPKAECIMQIILFNELIY